MRRTGAGAVTIACLVCALLLSGCTVQRYWGGGSDAGNGGRALVGLITKTDTNPYFVQLREAARAEADKLGAEFSALAGRFDGDNDGQVTALENLVQQGATTILITPNSSTGVLDAIKAARDKGILVIALDTETEPKSAVDATYATDNVAAGRKQGQYLKASLNGARPEVLMIDGTKGSSVDTQRGSGFLQGIGLGAADPAILGRQSANGDQNMAQEAAENLLQRASSVNTVYTMNEPMAEGARVALQSRGLRPTIGSIDGGCAGVRAVRDGALAVTVMQFPDKMARLGVRAAVDYERTGKKPNGFIDTGSTVITDQPLPGVPSETSSWGLQNCWGE